MLVKKNNLKQQQLYNDKKSKVLDNKASKSQPRESITSSGNSKDLIKNNKLSLKEFSRLSFDEQLDKYVVGSIPSYYSFSMGDTPDVYKRVGSRGESIFISKTIIDKVMKFHDISISELKLIPKKLEDPLYIFKGNSLNPNSIVSVIDMVDNQNRQIIVPIYMDEIKGNVTVNVIASIYGRNNYQDYVNNQIDKGNLLYKKK